MSKMAPSNGSCAQDATGIAVADQCRQWLFFQNVIQVQLHGGKNPIVLYWEMKLQSDLHVSNEPAAATSQWFNWSGPPSWITKLSLGRS
jgi:hypothetical protein